jgi:hypothetical protein
MQRLVRAVRGTGARQPILIGGLSYGGDVRGWLGYRPKDPLRRLVVSLRTFEFSACDAACEGVLAGLARRVPIVTTKLGQTDCAHDYIDSYMRFADSQGISYLGWTWNSGGDAPVGVRGDSRQTPRRGSKVRVRASRKCRCERPRPAHLGASVFSKRAS